MARGHPSSGKRPTEGGGTSSELSPEEQLSNCEAYLRTPPTDWDEIYLQLRYSALGDDFPRERFLATPCDVIFRALRWVQHREQLDANINSTSTAQLNHLLLQVAHGFSGSKREPPRTKPKNFLPFPEWRERTTQALAPSVVTRSTLDRLVVERRLPIRVYSVLASSAE